MARFLTTTCGLVTEAAVFRTSAPPELLGLAAVGLVVSGLLWCWELRPLVDRIVGEDL